MNRHLSSETLDLMMLSSVPARQAEEARNHLQSCPRCKARWEELDEDLSVAGLLAGADLQSM